MELSENDSIMLATARPGDLVILDAGVAKIVDKDAVSIDLMIMGCQAYHQCPSMAVTVIDHSVFGQVPACQRCAGILS